MTDDQIKQLALDWMAGRIFTDSDVQNKGDLAHVFLPLLHS